jgi:hypothetical protein
MFAESAHITLIACRVVGLALIVCNIAVVARVQSGIGIGVKSLLIVIGEIGRHGGWDCCSPADCYSCQYGTDK